MCEPSPLYLILPLQVPTPRSYLGPLPDDVLDLVGFVSELLEAQRLHSGRERLILKQALPLKALLFQDGEVLAVEAEGLVQRPFPVSPLSFPDQPVTEKARRCIGHLVSADFFFFFKKLALPLVLKSYKPKNPGINPNS